MAQKWHKEAEERAREEMERQLRDQERTRRPSRFEVIPAPDILKMQRQSANDLTMSPSNGAAPDHVSHVNEHNHRIFIQLSAIIRHPSRSISLSLPAHLPFPDIRLATEEVDLEEDQFLHVERVQPVGEPCSHSLHNCDRCGEQVKRNFKQFSTI